MTKNPAEYTKEFNQANPPAKAPSDDTVDTYHGVEVADPYRPLEDLEAASTREWTAGQNERFQNFIADVEDRDKLAEHLSDIWEYPREGLPARYGNQFFSSYNDGKSAQSVFQVRDSLEGEPRVLIDPNKMSDKGTIALSGTYPSPDGKLVAYLTSEGGSDKQTLRIKDVATGKDLPDVIENCRFTGVRWDRDSSKGFEYSYPAYDDKKRFFTKHHDIGAEAAKDPVVFEVPEEDSHTSVYGVRDENGKWGKYDFGYVRIGTNAANSMFIREHGSNAPFKPLFDDGKSTFSPVGEIDGKLLVETNHGAPMGKAVLVDPAHPEPENWQTVIPEQELDALEDVFIHKGKIFAEYMHDTALKISVHDLQGNHMHDVPVPEQVSGGFGKINPDDTEVLLSAGGFQSAGAKYKYNVDTNELELWKESQAKFDLKDAVVERIHATSKDGTKVPMTVIRGKDTELDGSAATLMYGYGGFNSPLTPGLGFSIYNWVKEGGVFVQTNLRGGGEFGQRWYDEGRLHNKQNVFDDFAACGEELIAQGYTKPERLAIEGGSNGGLLTLATGLQRPDLFGAIISQVPVTDMLRFHKHTYGAAWKSDYGDPENSKEDFDVSMKYSPLHNVDENVIYPPILVETAEFDDRVVPSHAFKFVATMQEKSPKTLCLMQCEKDAGHGAGKSKQKAIDGIVKTHAFLEQTLGPIDQKKYKAAAAEWAKDGKDADKSGSKWASAVREPANDHPRIKRSEGSELAR